MKSIEKKLKLKYFEYNVFNIWKNTNLLYSSTMSKKEEKKVCYVCALYGGVMKQQVVRFMVFDNAPDVECEQYKKVYGSDVKARCAKVKDSSEAVSKKLKDYLPILIFIILV